jgi:adenylate cyclase
VAEVRAERRLAAILAADVVGYSRLMAADETGTHTRLKALRKDFIEPTIAAHHGRIVKLLGDGALVEFASAVDAVECAVAIQRGVAERQEDVREEQRIAFRIGINIGDIISEEGDIYGDGVNVAARLEALAEPEGICLSGDAYRQVRKLALDFEDMGEREVKNIAEPIRVFRVRSARTTDALETPAPPRRGLALPDKPAIAVLPFVNMSGDPDQEHFADGLTEDIITGLAAWHWFPVTARHSSLAYKGKNLPIGRIAEELGARYLVEGSVRRAGNRVRVTAELVDGTSGHHLWARRFDRDLTDIFAIQDEITEQIVVTIEPAVSRAERHRALRKPPDNLDAWDCALRALNDAFTFTREGSREAKRMLVQALELDPGLGYALSLLALCHFEDAILGFGKDRDHSLTESLQAAERAVAIDDADWLAHAVQGIAVLWRRRDFAFSLIEEERAIELNPSSTLARLCLSCVLEFGGRPQDAVPQLHTSLRLDPHSPILSHVYNDLALCYFLLREHDAAVEAASKAVEINRGNVRGRQRLVAALAELGRVNEARLELERLLRHQPDFDTHYVNKTYPFQHAEDAEFFIQALRKAGWHG